MIAHGNFLSVPYWSALAPTLLSAEGANDETTLISFLRKPLGPPFTEIAKLAL